jgi:DNA-binding transcriptional LysR family regulator
MAKLENIKLKDFADEPFMSFCRNCAPGLYDRIITLCNRVGFSPKIIHESSQINSVVRLVESQLGYSIVPTSVKKGYNLQVKFMELDQCPERAELALAYHTDYLTPIIEKFIDLVLSIKL